MNSDQRSSGIFCFASLVNHHKSHAAGFSTSSNHVEIDSSKEFDKRITINLQPSASEWLWRSAIAELKAISSPDIIQDAFSKLHFEGVKVRSLRGLFMIITFQSKVERNRALSNMVFKDWFKSFKHWNGEGASLSRLVWLKCRGMPLNVWCLKSFKRICEEWGEFITLDQETLLEEAFDIGRFLMVTDFKYKIDQWINITVNGRNYRVHVWEEECNDPFDVMGVKQGVNQYVQSNQGEDDVEVSQAKFQAYLAEDSKSIPIIEKRSMNVEGQKTENNKVFEEDVDKANIIMEDNNMVEQLRELSNEVVEETGASGKTLMSDAINEATNEQHFGVPMSAKLSTQVKSGRVNEEISNSTQGLDPFVEDLIDPLLMDGQERDSINGDSLLDSAQSEEAQDLPDARLEDLQRNHEVDTFEDSHIPILATVKGGKGKKKRKTIDEILGFSKVNSYNKRGGKNKNKCVVLRSAVAAAALSASISSDGINNRNRIVLNEAQTIWEMNKLHGIGYDGDENEVISKIAEMIVHNKEKAAAL